MTDTQQETTVPYVVTITRDAAAPISQALNVIYAEHRGGWRVRDVSFVYSDDGVTVTASPKLNTDDREAMYGHFIATFRAAGWGFSTRLNQTMTYRRNVLFRHPSQLTRLDG